MGDPKKQRRKYETPRHPWQGPRIEKEKKLKKTYGLKNKKEIWKMESLLRKFKRQAKQLTARTDNQAKKEKELLLKKVYSLGILEMDAKMENILDLDANSILDRRLQTIMCKKELARTAKQSRQFITHRHVLVDSKKVSIPSYIVKRDEENKITFDQGSSLNNKEHPERIVEKKEKTLKVTPKKELAPKVEKTPIIIKTK